MRKIARRKKPTRKYIPRNEFRHNNSKAAGGHPHYIFGESDGKYFSLGLTTHPTEKYPAYSLSASPNPVNGRKNYLRKDVFNDKKKYYRKKNLEGWKFSDEDMALVRHLTKSFKKSQNRTKKKSR